MKTISEIAILERIQFENPWWGSSQGIDPLQKQMRPRAYLSPFCQLINQRKIQRAIVLMGPRRVGKTCMIHHAIQSQIDNGVDPRDICYISIDAPIYTGIRLESLVKTYLKATQRSESSNPTIFFDEIQYLSGWEVHLKKLVEDFPTIKFVASGSAAAALRLSSMESGAGRFSDFKLPPLTFHEFLYLQDRDGLIDKVRGAGEYGTTSIKALNDEFVNYLNFGGYPEALFSPEIRADPQRFIRSDIIDKVLLRDLPSLYGIGDIQELNRLFMMLAYNTGDEVSLEGLSQGSGVAKNTIKRYLDYLEAAFLITIMHRVDHCGKNFKRANFFKVYLTNPSMRCALFGPISPDHADMGHLAETAVVSQWLHSSTGPARTHYARWHKGEVDLVYHIESKVAWCVEVKWSNRYFEHPDELKGLLFFLKSNKLQDARVTTIDKEGKADISGAKLEFQPTSLYCYTVGRNTLKSKGAVPGASNAPEKSASSIASNPQTPG